MMREIAGFIAGIIIVGYILYFAFPLLTTEHTAEMSLLNMTDPTILLSSNLGQGFYSALPFVGVLVGVFLIISYAIRRDPLE